MPRSNIILVAIFLFWLTACGTSNATSVLPTFTAEPPPQSSPGPTITPSNTPTLVPPTVTPTLIPSRETSIQYPAETISAFVGQVETAKGDIFEIPIYIGMTREVVENQENPISGLVLAPEVVDAMAGYWLYVNYYRFSKDTVFKGTYEEYLELLGRGEGGVKMLSWDQGKDGDLAVKTVDPLRGFTITWTEEEKMIVTSPGWEFSFDVDEGGRFHGSTNYYLLYNDHLTSMVKKNGPTMEVFGQEYDTDALFEGTFVTESLDKILTIYGDLDLECLVGGNVTLNCGVISVSDDFRQLSDVLDVLMMNSAILGNVDELIKIIRPE
ncbi:MAG: hypothetical protein JW757_11970 [Anaerolineales bacterium]|nr:hypothetical protein [Anaerolineales bacterium]